ncbi:uncharacterized protein METZ01_LOCUS178090 [marine metagenome]|uniref:Bacteriophage T5 Orf172 DNA-binding domain-containing protein n=1 Tax=marine metagenome TaxID=408172 RepID=A0A382CGL8_9ZZZZ
MSETNFQKWLELTTDLAEKTIKNYLGAISKIDSNLAEQNIVQMSLEELDSVESLEQIKKDYFSNPENKKMDETGNQMYSAAFNKFISYKDSQGSKPLGNQGIVYILSNPAMPGLVKVGKTINLEERLKSLFSSGVPLPFRCVYAKKVKDYNLVERKLHRGLKSHRENENREFFRIAEEEIINFLELVEGEDVTPREDQFEDKVDEVAFQKATRIGQRFNFEMVDISKGSVLTFIRDEQVSCKVISNNRVEFEGENHSLSSAALIATNRMGFKWKSIAGPLNWMYEGEVLDVRRSRLESSD